MARSSSTGPGPPRPAADEPLPAAQAASWLAMQLSAERASMNHQMELRHKELVQQFELMVGNMQGRPKHSEKMESHTKDTNLLAAVAGRRSPRANKANDGDLHAHSPSRFLTKTSNGSSGSSLHFESESSREPTQRLKSARTLPGEVIDLETKGCGCLSRLVTSSKFEVTFAILIVLNSLVMAVEVQYDGQGTAYQLGYKGALPPEEAWRGADTAFRVLDIIFGVIFTLEVVTKLVVLHRRFLSHTWWNLFDLLVMAAWLTNQIMLSALPLDPTLWRVARFAKLARLLRAVKLVKAVHPLILMVKAISASVSILCWSMLLLAMMVSFLAIIMCVLMEPWLRDDSIDVKKRIMLFESWGSFTRSFASMSELTLDDFGPRLRELQDTVAEYWGMVVLAYKFTIGFAVVQVVTSVFIQQTFNVAWIDEEVMIREKTRAAQSYAGHLGKLFEFLDESGDGMITKEEFSIALEDDRVERWFHALELDAEDVRELFDMLAGEDGQIDRSEFMNGLKILHGKAKTSSMIILFDGLSKKLKAVNDKVDMLTGEVQLRYAMTNGGSTPQPPLHHPQDLQDASCPAKSSPIEPSDKDRSPSLQCGDATSRPHDRDNSGLDASDIGPIEVPPSSGPTAHDAKAAARGPRPRRKPEPDETPRTRAYRLACVKSNRIPEPVGELAESPTKDSI